MVLAEYAITPSCSAKKNSWPWIRRSLADYSSAVADMSQAIKKPRDTSLWFNEVTYHEETGDCGCRRAAGAIS
jgi:hypothetical protein